MKGKRIREFLKKKRKAAGCVTLAAAVLIGAAVWQPAQEPDFPSYTDPVMEVTIEEEETPLASTPKVVTTTSKKKTTKKVKLKKAAKKTYTKKLPTTTKKTTSSSKSGNTTVTKETKVVTATTEKYKKKKKVKTVTKTVTTTIKTTTVTQDSQSSSGTSSGDSSSSDSSSDSSSSSTTSTTKAKYEADVASIAPNMDSRVLNAYKTLGFKVYVDESVTSYSGYFNAKSQSITLRSADSTIYHELGHFLAFIANNYDRGSAFASVYSSEKSLYTGTNKSYVTQSASEYFAESVRDYIIDNASLKANRPKTYAAVETALNMVTDTQVARIQKLYGAYWS